MTVVDIIPIGIIASLGIGVGLMVWLWRSAPLDDWDKADASMFEDGDGG